jgi:hypothetical protein
MQQGGMGDVFRLAGRFGHAALPLGFRPIHASVGKRSGFIDCIFYANRPPLKYRKKAQAPKAIQI